MHTRSILAAGAALALLWGYFPEMQPDEALLIKTYDSATDGRARFTLHTSFDDPTAAADAEPRESLETRCFAFF